MGGREGEDSSESCDSRVWVNSQSHAVVAVERRPGRGAERASRYVYCDGLKERAMECYRARACSLSRRVYATQSRTIKSPTATVWSFVADARSKTTGGARQNLENAANVNASPGR